MGKSSEKLASMRQDMFVMQQLIRRDKKHGTSDTSFGSFWEILNPLINMMVMALVFGKMFGSGFDELYSLYILTGTSIHGLFTRGTSACLNALSGNKNFLIKTQLSKNLYVLEKVMYSFQNFLYSVVIYIGMMLYHEVEITWYCLWVIPDLLLLMIMMLGVGKILATINVEFADVTYFYKIFTLMLMYGSAVFYDISRMGKHVQFVMQFNPIYAAITIIRDTVIGGIEPELNLVAVLAGYAVVMYGIGTYVFKKGTNDLVARL